MSGRLWSGGDWRWRGRLSVPQHAHPLVRLLFAEANAQMTTLSEICKRAGLRRGTVGQWGRVNTPRVDDLEAALNVLGYELRAVEKKDTPPDGPAGRK